MTAREDGLTWRLARLHPLLVFAVLFMALILVVYLDEIVIEPESRFRGFVPSLGIAIYSGYPLFVILFVSGRFASRSTPRFKLPVAAFVAVQLFGLVVTIMSSDLRAALQAGELMIALPFWTLWLLCAVSLFYLLIVAAYALVEAERGPYRSGHQVFGAVLLFFYGPFGWYFLHRRVRRLVANYETCDPIAIELPTEKLVMEKGASGHLGLELTERIGWDDFENYATEILRRLDARVIERATMVDMHLWDVEVETVPLRLVYEDHPDRIILESSSFPGDMMLKKLRARLSPAA